MKSKQNKPNIYNNKKNTNEDNKKQIKENI